ncbi:MAG: four helix bundle protein [Flavobacteriaceae bacterium]|nr:four helix bundle protein [Flavobacteriaceae bacterium]
MNNEIRSFEDLKCWKKARELRIQISKLAQTFPMEEKFGLISQIIRASRSVTHNIAEGYGRFHYKENAKFCRNARGSLYEVLDQLIVAKDESYISDATLEEYKKFILENIKILNGYIKYLVEKGSTNN